MTFYITSPMRRAIQRSRFLEHLNEMEAEREVMVPVDVQAEADSFVIKAMLPGVNAEELNIQIVNETVSIQGNFKVEREEQDTYLLQERPSGNFCRTLTLPDSLDSAKAEAGLKDGILTLRIPKAEEARPKTIKVVTKEN